MESALADLRLRYAKIHICIFISLIIHVFHYDRKNNRLIGATFTNGTDKYDNTVYIVTVDLNTGKTLSKIVAQGVNFISGDERDYDAETNSYVLVNYGLLNTYQYGNNDVLFFDLTTGKVKERYPLDFDVTSLKIWRSNK